MSEDYVLPELPEGMRWDNSNLGGRYWAVWDGKYTRAMVETTNRALIYNFKTMKFTPYFGAKTQQEALNHAAALLFLGEGDE
jgi:hypothetical protein